MMLLMRTTLNLDTPILENAKAAAVGRGVTLGELVEDAVRAYLAPKDVATVPPFQLHTVRGTLIQPDLDLTRTSALLLAEDVETYGKHSS